MSHSISEPNPDPRYATRGSVYVPAKGGVTKWFSGDVYTVKLAAASTSGALGVIEASIPPGCGPGAHTHVDQDETFYLLSGELEFLNGYETFIAGPGDLVFVPRRIRHRFKNRGLHPARMLFLYTPGGTEGHFIEGGDEPQPGVQAPPWGPERRNQQFFELLGRYGIEALPEAP